MTVTLAVNYIDDTLISPVMRHMGQSGKTLCQPILSTNDSKFSSNICLCGPKGE